MPERYRAPSFCFLGAAAPLEGTGSFVLVSWGCCVPRKNCAPCSRFPGAAGPLKGTVSLVIVLGAGVLLLFPWGNGVVSVEGAASLILVSQGLGTVSLDIVFWEPLVPR